MLIQLDATFQLQIPRSRITKIIYIVFALYQQLKLLVCYIHFIWLAWLDFHLLALRFQYDMRAIVHSECNLTIATKKYLTFVAVRNAMQVKWNEISLNAIHCVSKSKPLFLFGIIANQNDDDDGHDDNDSKN